MQEIKKKKKKKECGQFLDGVHINTQSVHQIWPSVDGASIASVGGPPSDLVVLPLTFYSIYIK